MTFSRHFTFFVSCLLCFQLSATSLENEIDLAVTHNQAKSPHLNCTRNALSPIAATFTNLRTLSIDSMNVSKPSDLRHFYMDSRDLRSFSTIQGHTELLLLQLSNVHLSQSIALSNCDYLRHLTLIKNGLEVLPDLSVLPELKSLDIRENPLKSTTQLKIITNLTHLRLRACSLRNVPEVVELLKLINLDLLGNQLKEPPVIETLTNLAALDLSQNPMTRPPKVTNHLSLRGVRLNRELYKDAAFMKDLRAILATNKAIDSTRYLQCYETFMNEKGEWSIYHQIPLNEPEQLERTAVSDDDDQV